MSHQHAVRMAHDSLALTYCIWWRMTGSNRRPPACKAGALPAELIPRRCLMAGMRYASSAPSQIRSFAPISRPALRSASHLAFPGFRASTPNNFGSAAIPCTQLAIASTSANTFATPCLVGLVGFEPTTPALSRRCSNQLSYRPAVFTKYNSLEV